MAIHHSYVIKVANHKRNKYLMSSEEHGYDYDKNEAVHRTLSTNFTQDQIIHMLEICDLSKITPEEAQHDGTNVRAEGKDGKKYTVHLAPSAISHARMLQNKKCPYCCMAACRCDQKYPQGWRHYPGDTCKHGMYVGGCGVDWICGKCEVGED